MMVFNQARVEQRLNNGLDALSMSLDDTQRDKLVGYVERLNKWNKAYNLTSVRDPEEMVTKHLLDALAVAPYLNGQHIVDVGTGPGLPGIPLAIAFPDKAFTLVDSLGKRVRFMTQCVHDLDIKNVLPIHSRIEDHVPAQKYDIVISRAFASLKDMLHWCQHLVDSQGSYLAMKGQVTQDELSEVSSHYLIKYIERLHVPELVGERHVVSIERHSGK
jgi:16S rRNA (guanine527-N7)-methyltransferase